MIALLAGHPRGPGWDELMKSLEGDISAAANLTGPQIGGNRHRRGQYPAVNIGVSHGGGSHVRIPYIPELRLNLG